MSTITKEQAQKIIEAADEVITALAGTNEDVHPESDSMLRLWDDLNDRYAPPEVVRELARIALASLEAEPVAYIFKHPAGRLFWALTDESNKGQSDVMPVYTAPPAPANAEPVAWLWSHRKHPSEVTLVRHEDDERAEGAHWSGWSCQALYAEPPASVSVPDGYRLQPISEYDAMCAAMLQGADGNSPVIPDGWVAFSERMPDDDDFVYIWPRPDFGVELHVGQYCECHPKGDGWYAQVYEQNYGIEWCPITVTHWMPLPAAPKQELK